MNLTTGYGRCYRYSKCTSQVNKEYGVCISRKIPMEKLVEMIIKAMSEKYFVQEWFAAMLKELQDRLYKSGSERDQHVQT